MPSPYDMYPEGWGRESESPLMHRASVEELRFLESRGVDVTDLQEDERLARDVRSADRVRQAEDKSGAAFAGRAAVNFSLEARN